jgi:hypothetical protein
MMNRSQKIILSISLTALVLLSTACGGQAYTQIPTGSSSNNLGSSNYNHNSSTSGSKTDSATDDDTSDTPTYGTNPAIKKSFTTNGIQGTRGYTGTPGSAHKFRVSGISTDNRLSVDLRGSSLGKIRYLNSTTSYTGATLYSNCMQFDIAIYETGTDNQIGDTLTISANTYSTDGTGSCGSGSASPTVDFGSYLAQGHGKVDIEINNAASDTCGPSSYCNWISELTQLYQTYVVFGSLTIHTNTTL